NARGNPAFPDSSGHPRHLGRASWPSEAKFLSLSTNYRRMEGSAAELPCGKHEIVADEHRERRCRVGVREHQFAHAQRLDHGTGSRVVLGVVVDYLCGLYIGAGGV